jgi:biopolymer transport protein ExbD
VPVRPWMVQSRVREALANGDAKTVLVITDRRVTAEALIEVVDQARLAGATDVGVVTELEAGEG